jgi:hypothetical protein
MSRKVGDDRLRLQGSDIIDSSTKRPQLHRNIRRGSRPLPDSTVISS